MEVWILFLYNTNLSFALKNQIGQYEIKDFVLFNINSLNDKSKNIYVKYTENKEIIFKIKCPLCNKYHYYTYNLYTFFKRKITIGGCDLLGEQIFLIGQTEKVIEMVNKYIDMKNKAYAML